MQMQKSKFDGKQHNLAQNMKKYISAELTEFVFCNSASGRVYRQQGYSVLFIPIYLTVSTFFSFFSLVAIFGHQ